MAKRCISFFFVLSLAFGGNWLPNLASFAQAQTSLATSSTAVAAVIPNDPFWNKQWYLRQIHAPEAWTATTGSHDVIVAVIDGAVDIDHPDLKDNIWTNPHPDPVLNDVHGWNFVNNSPDVRPVYDPNNPEDAWGHGTLVSSLIAAKGNNGVGISGVTWNVQLMPLVVLDQNGSGSVGAIIKALQYATSHGANIINMSLAGYDYDENLDQMIDNVAKAGVLVVAATGNETSGKMGLNTDITHAYPACMHTDLILAVSGTDTLDQKAPYANYGKSCTSLAAPAQELFAARPFYPPNVKGDGNPPGYVDGITGTSLAAPLVSGAAALLKSIHPNWLAAQLRQRLISTADNIDDSLDVSEKGGLGSGRLNVARAVLSDWSVTSSAPLAPGSDVQTLTAVTSSVMIATDLHLEAGQATFSYTRGTHGIAWLVPGTILQAFWLEMATGTKLAVAVTRDQRQVHFQSWNPQTGEIQDKQMTLAGRGPWLSSLQLSGQNQAFILFTSPTSPEVIRWDVSHGKKTGWRPFGKTYLGGVQQLHWSTTRGWLLWPTTGLGHAMILDGRGRLLNDALPLGKLKARRWSLRLGERNAEVWIKADQGSWLMLRRRGNDLERIKGSFFASHQHQIL